MSSSIHGLRNFIALFLFIIFSQAAGYAQTAVMPSGSGTEADPYLVANIDNLYWVTQNTSSWGSYFRQTANIDASSSFTWDGGAGMTPIGNNTIAYFTGNYNGQNFTISNIRINRPGLDRVGLFGRTDKFFADPNRGKILNLRVDGTVIGGNSTGILVGANGADITNCYTSGDVEGTYYVGGLNGVSFSSAFISYCGSEAVVTGTGFGGHGGLIGAMNGADVSYSYATGNVIGVALAGGLVGHLESGNIVSNCYARGNITGTNFKGGLVGAQSNDCSITNSFSTGSISSGGTRGGLIGENGGTVTNSFWDTQTSGLATSAGGTGKTTAEMKTEATFTGAGWDFTTVWDMDGLTNDGYAFLIPPAGDPTLSLTYPNGSEEIVRSTTAAILWTSANVSNVKIEFSSNNGADWNLVIASTPSDGSYDWSVPSSTTNEALIRITDASDAALFDESDAEFFIVLGEVIPTGTGTELDPLLLNSVEHLNFISNNSSEWNKVIVQTANIDASETVNLNGGTGLTPIGNTVTPFTGTYDGQDNSIDNLYINRDEDNQAMFGKTSNASVINLKLNNAEVTGRGNTAALIADARATFIHNIFINAVVTNVNSFTHSGAVFARYTKLGALSNMIPTISQVYSTGSVTGGDYVGGIGGSSDGDMIDCYSTATVTGDSYVGGLLGKLETGGTITSSYAVSPVTGSSFTGGLVGDNSGTVSTSFWNTDIFPTSPAGTGKNTSEMKTLSTFLDADWNFIDIWGIDGGINNGYPDLRWNSLLPSEVTVTSPNGGEYWVAGTQHEITWESQGVNTVDIERSTDNGSNWWAIAGNVDASLGTYTWNVTDLSDQMLVRVSSFDDNLINDVSDAVFIAGVGTPILASPSNGAVNQSLKPTLGWSVVDYANDYLLQVNTLDDFTGTSIYDGATGNITSLEISGLDDNTTYFWRVKAKNGAILGETFSDTWSFTTLQANTTFPVNNSNNVPTSFIFTWPVVTGADKYRIEAATNVGFVSPVIDVSNLITNSYDATGLTYNTVYFWRITASSNANVVYTSGGAEFRTMLDLPSLTSPTLDEVVLTLTPTFSWTGPDGADRWDIRIYSNSDMTLLVDSVDNLTTASHTPAALTKNTPYWWKVRGRTDATGNQGNFASSNFSTLDIPTMTSVTNPLHDAKGIVLNPLIEWSTSTGLGTIKYELQVATDPSFESIYWIEYQGNMSGTSYTVVNTLSYYTNYWARTRAYNQAGFTEWSAPIKFRTQVAPVTLVYPANGSEGHPLTPTLSWEALAQADNYDVQVDNNSDFSSPEFTATTANLYADVTGLTDNVTYYWRVRGVESLTEVDYPGAWSASWTFKVIAGTVPTPYLAWPIGNPIVYSASQQLSWYLGLVATVTYHVQYTTDPTFLTNVTEINTANTTANASGLSASTTYYWRVRCYSAGLGIYGSFTAVESFTTDPSIGPVTPSPVYPTGGTTVYTTAPTLYWSTGAAPSGLTYDIEYNTNGVFTGTPTISGISSTSLALSGLTGGSTYHWKVRSFYAGGYSGWSSEATFVVDGSVGGGTVVPIPSYPTSGTTVYTTTPSLSWYLGAVGTGLTYDIEIQLLEDAFTGVPTETGITGLSYTVDPALTAGESYHWQVRSSNGSSWSTWSIAAEFEVDGGSGGGGGTPGNVIPTYPIDGGTVYTIAPSIYWYLSVWQTGLTFKVHYGTASGVYPYETSASSNYYAPLSGLLAGTTYYYQVEAIGSGGNSFSAEESFIVAGGSGTPSVPNPNWPVGGAVIYSTSQSLYWWMYTTVGVVSYRVLVSNNPDLSDSTVYTSAGFSVALTGLTAGETYYWAVQSFDGTNYSAYSATESFTVNGGDNPVRPIVGGPSGNMVIGTLSPVLTWRLPVNQTGQTYELEYSKYADFTSPVKVENISNLNHQVQNLLSGINYYWRVRSVKNGLYSNYSYRGKFLPFDGTTSVGDEDVIPEKFTVNQNYPNPFNPTTVIRFGLPVGSYVTVKIFNMLGQEIKTLLGEDLNAGTHRVTWHGDNNNGQKVTSGTYIYRVSAGANVLTMKMIYLK